MEFNQQENNKNSIISVKNNTIQLSHTKLDTPCFISSNYYAQVEIEKIEEVSSVLLFPLISKDNINLLIIGTGVLPKFIHPKQQVKIQKIGVSIESMNTASACRSFNLLLSDARLVGLLLL